MDVDAPALARQRQPRGGQRPGLQLPAQGQGFEAAQRVLRIGKAGMGAGGEGAGAEAASVQGASVDGASVEAASVLGGGHGVSDIGAARAREASRGTVGLATGWHRPLRPR